MPQCPHCLNFNAIYIERDVWGLWEVCIYCGWERFIKSQSQKSLGGELKVSQRLRSEELIHHGNRMKGKEEGENFSLAETLFILMSWGPFPFITFQIIVWDFLGGVFSLFCPLRGFPKTSLYFCKKIFSIFLRILKSIFLLFENLQSSGFFYLF